MKSSNFLSHTIFLLNLASVHDLARTAESSITNETINYLKFPKFLTHEVNSHLRIMVWINCEVSSEMIK